MLLQTRRLLSLDLLVTVFYVFSRKQIWSLEQNILCEKLPTLLFLSREGFLTCISSKTIVGTRIYIC